MSGDSGHDCVQLFVSKVKVKYFGATSGNKRNCEAELLDCPTPNSLILLIPFYYIKN